MAYVALLRIPLGRSLGGPDRGAIGEVRASVRRFGPALWITIAMGIQLLGVAIAGAIVLQIAENRFAALLVLLAVLWVVLGVSLSLAILVMEDVRGFSACGRSWRLIRSRTLRSIGVAALAFLIVILSQVVLTLIPTSALGYRGIDAVARAAFEGLIGALVTTFTGCVLAVLYLELVAGEGSLDPGTLRRELEDA